MEIARKISEETQLDLVDVLSLALRGGLQAIKDNGFEMPLPLRLKVDKETPKTTYPEHREETLLAAEEYKKKQNPVDTPKRPKS